MNKTNRKTLHLRDGNSVLAVRKRTSGLNSSSGVIAVVAMAMHLPHTIQDVPGLHDALDKFIDAYLQDDSSVSG